MKLLLEKITGKNTNIVSHTFHATSRIIRKNKLTGKLEKFFCEITAREFYIHIEASVSSSYC
jgi:hypothetical protein